MRVQQLVAEMRQMPLLGSSIFAITCQVGADFCPSKSSVHPLKRLEDSERDMRVLYAHIVQHEVQALQASRLEVRHSDAVGEVWRRYINEVASLSAALEI